MLAIVIAVAAVTNRLELRRVPLSMLALCSLFIALNLLASAWRRCESNIAARYLAVTLYCIAIGFWICGYVDSERRARLVIKAYIASAVAISVASRRSRCSSRSRAPTCCSPRIFERARGLFKDPNVYGPYLIPAALILAQESLQPRLLKLNRPTQIFCFVALAAGILFSLLARRVAEPGDRRAS